MSLETNRDLYLALRAALEKQDRTLREYLLALRAELQRHRDVPALSPEQFVAALAAACTAPVEPVDSEAWRNEDLAIEDHGPQTAEDVDRVLRSQILDLEDARATGLERDEDRSFGLDISRRGAGERATGPRWYNWDPAGYIECAAAATFGGHHPGDREPVRELTWSDVGEFLWAGQIYE